MKTRAHHNTHARQSRKSGRLQRQMEILARKLKREKKRAQRKEMKHI